MNRNMDTGTFFNRTHLIQAVQILGMAFCMIDVIFVGLDELRVGFVRPLLLAFLGVGATLAALAALVSGRVRMGVLPFLNGVAVGSIYLAAVWLMARGVT